MLILEWTNPLKSQSHCEAATFFNENVFAVTFFGCKIAYVGTTVIEHR